MVLWFYLVLVLGGFYSKVLVAEYTRDNKILTLGICLGFQAMAIAQARKQGIANATSKESATNGQEQEFILIPFYEMAILWI